MVPEMIIFDCDGVIVDSEVLSVRGMVSVLNDAGLPVTYAMIAPYFGMKQADILLKLSEELGRDIGLDLAAKIWPATRELFTRHLQPMPGLAEMLDRHSDIKRCVASSSSPERIRHSLSVTRLSPYFGDAIFSSSQVARGKPAPDLFLFAAASMDIEPHRCVVVEDSKFGVRGALAAGIPVIGFVGGSHIAGEHAAALGEAGAQFVEPDWEAVEQRIFSGALHPVGELERKPA